MQQKPNQWIISYIKQHLKEKSRYEIDLHLIQAGHTPTEVEIAWELIGAKKVSNGYIPDYSWGKQDKQESSRLIGMVAGILCIIATLMLMFGGEEIDFVVKSAYCGVILLSILQIIGAWLATKQAKPSAFLQLFTSVTCLLITIPTFSLLCLAVVPLALLYSVGGAIALSTSSSENSWLQKIWLVLLLDLLLFLSVTMGLGTLAQLILKS